MNYKPTQEYCDGCKDYEGQARGAGDLIHSLAKKTGVDKIANAIERKTKKPCGCNKRRTKLNQLLPRKTD